MPRTQFNQDEGVRVPKSSLTVRTRNNLSALERLLGCKFDDFAYKYPVEQEKSLGYYGYRGRVPPKIPTRTAYTIVIWGTGPQGEYQYVRRETASPGAGQTLLYINGARNRVSDILQQGEYRIPQ